MLVGTLTNILVKKFLGKKFIPRFGTDKISLLVGKEGGRELRGERRA